jgi:hypothetical protein
VERFVSWGSGGGGHSNDLFGVGDLLAVAEGKGILLLQVCAASGYSVRRRRAEQEARLRVWLAAGGRFEIWAFRAEGRRLEWRTAVARLGQDGAVQFEELGWTGKMRNT